MAEAADQHHRLAQYLRGAAAMTAQVVTDLPIEA
jgi:hypothetical protein